MAEFVVNTDKLRKEADRLQELQRQMNSISSRLAGIRISSALKSSSVSTLNSRIRDCKNAVGNQASNLRKLSDGLDSVAGMYDKTERELTEPKTEAQEETGPDLAVPESIRRLLDQLINPSPSPWRTSWPYLAILSIQAVLGTSGGSGGAAHGGGGRSFDDGSDFGGHSYGGNGRGGGGGGGGGVRGESYSSPSYGSDGRGGGGGGGGHIRSESYSSGGATSSGGGRHSGGYSFDRDYGGNGSGGGGGGGGGVRGESYSSPSYGSDGRGGGGGGGVRGESYSSPSYGGNGRGGGGGGGGGFRGSSNSSGVSSGERSWASVGASGSGDLWGIPCSGEVGASLGNQETKRIGEATWDVEKGEIKAEAGREYSYHGAKAEASGSIGLLGGEAEISAGNFSTSGTVNATLYEDGRLSPQLGAEVKVEGNLLEGEAEAYQGTKNYNKHIKAEGSLVGGEASAEAKAGVITSTDDDGETTTRYGATAGVDLEWYLAEGEVSGGYTFMGIDIDVGISGKAGGAGFEAEAEVTTGGLSGEIGAGLGLGAGVEISIDWSDFDPPTWEEIGQGIQDFGEGIADFFNW